MDKIRVGLIFYTAGHRIPVEKGFQMIGHTVHDPKIGEQVFWFKSEADFLRDRREIFENYGRGMNRPVPHFEVIGEAPEPEEPDAATVAKGFARLMKLSPEEEEALIAHAVQRIAKLKAGMDPEEDETEQETVADDILKALADRTMPMADFAKELGLSEKVLGSIVKDPRFSVTASGLVSATPAPTPPVQPTPPAVVITDKPVTVEVDLPTETKSPE